MTSPVVTVLPRRILVIAGVLLLVIAGAIGFSRGPGASAATIDGAITDVNVVQTTAGPHTAMRVDLDWSVPTSAKSGDTFSLQLPPELQAVSRSFDLLAPDGSVVATAVENNGVVTFTLTSYADTHSAIKGTAFFTVRFDLDNISGAGPVPLKFTSGSSVFPDSVTLVLTGNVDRTRPHKSGSWTDPVLKDSGSGVDALTWNIDSSVGPFATMTVEDDVSAGQAFDCSTLSFQLADGVDQYGSLTGVHKLPTKQVISSSCTTAKVLVTVGPALTGQVIRVHIESSITDSSLATYTNSAAVTIDGKTYSSVSGKVERDNAGGNGGGTSSPSTSVSATSTSTSPSSTSTTTGTATVSATTTTTTSTTGTTTTGGATVLPTELTSSRAPSTLPAAAALPFTGADVAPMLGVAAVLLGGGAVLLLSGRRQRKH